MENFINLKEYPIAPVLKLLLADKTTKENIVFATSSYEHLGDKYKEDCHMDPELLLGPDAIEFQPRVLKEAADQAGRTRKNAEVMTPAWIVNKMNNHCDEEWFGFPGSFNTEDGKRWVVNTNKVFFPKGKSWQAYVDCMRLEITCGEAPYIVSRYDTTTGAVIPVKDRIGILDRKLRVVNENTEDRDEWMKWVIRAYQSTYGYEWQGDNLLIARINALITFVDYMKDKWNEKPSNADLRKIANIIAWNFWQMDGLNGTVPYAVQEADNQQIMLLDFDEEQEIIMEPMPARIYDWRGNESVTYNSIKGA